jgi:hypothetical protein
MGAMMDATRDMRGRYTTEERKRGKEEDIEKLV